MKKTKISEPSSVCYVIAISKQPLYRGLGISNMFCIEDRDGADLNQMKRRIDAFLRYALNQSDVTFKVIPFGKDEEISTMFAFAPNNVKLHKRWEKHLPWQEGRVYWS